MNSEDSVSINPIMNVAFVIRRIPHYRIPFYRLLINQNKDLNIWVYYGTPEKTSGGSGLIYNSEFPFALKLKSFGIGTLICQRGLIRNGLLNKIDLAVFEGSARLISSNLILFIRKMSGKKNMIWLKGWPEEIEKIPRIKFYLKKIYLSLADGYLVYGNQSLKSLEVYKIDETRITVVQNTVDVEDLLSKKYLNMYSRIGNTELKKLLSGRIPYIYNIGRIITAKRVDDLIAAFRKINDNSPSSTQLFIAGDGPNLSWLKKEVTSHNLTSIHFLGSISEEESKILYANCLFCVFPGEVGLSLNEALAAGKAVICADEAGPDSELLVHAHNGLRYERGNIDKLAEYMELLMNNKEIRDGFGEKAFETISQKATLNNMVNKFSLAMHFLLKRGNCTAGCSQKRK